MPSGPDEETGVQLPIGLFNSFSMKLAGISMIAKQGNMHGLPIVRLSLNELKIEAVKP